MDSDMPSKMTAAMFSSSPRPFVSSQVVIHTIKCIKLREVRKKCLIYNADKLNFVG